VIAKAVPGRAIVVRASRDRAVGVGDAPMRRQSTQAVRAGAPWWCLAPRALTI